jgi:lipoprotein-releasing system permease protein
MTFEFFISRRYFKSKPNQTIIALITILSIIGVAIGVTALIVVIAVMGGFESDLKSRILGIEPHLVIEKHAAPMEDYQRIAELCEQNNQVISAWPVVKVQVMLRSELRVSGP